MFVVQIKISILSGGVESVCYSARTVYVEQYSTKLVIITLY